MCFVLYDWNNPADFIIFHSTPMMDVTGETKQKFWSHLSTQHHNFIYSILTATNNQHSLYRIIFTMSIIDYIFQTFDMMNWMLTTKIFTKSLQQNENERCCTCQCYFQNGHWASAEFTDLTKMKKKTIDIWL